MIEVDDGVMSYFLGISAVSGLGFAVDKDLHQARNDGRFVEVAMRRDYDIIATTTYFKCAEEYVKDREALKGALQASFFLKGQEVSDYEFSVLQQSLVESVCLIKIEEQRKE